MTRQKTLKALKSNIVNKVRLKLNDSLCCILDNFSDEKVDGETSRIKNEEDLEEKEKNSLKSTYVNAVLCYLAIILDKNFKDPSSFFHIMEKELFDLIPKGRGWEPNDAPWLTAKVCLSVSDGYDALSDINKDKISAILEDLIIYGYDYDAHAWRCGVGSHLDTYSLNCEVLLKYISKMTDEKQIEDVKNVLFDIFKAYFADGRIYETLALYPIGESIMEAIKNEKRLHGKLFHKKMLGRIEFLSVILRIVCFFEKENPDFVKPYAEEKTFLVTTLGDFIGLFIRYFDDISPKIKDEEVLAIPQILYSVYKAFMEMD